MAAAARPGSEGSEGSKGSEGKVDGACGPEVMAACGGGLYRRVVQKGS